MRHDVKTLRCDQHKLVVLGIAAFIHPKTDISAAAKSHGLGHIAEQQHHSVAKIPVFGATLSAAMTVYV